jgi:hypothetical protein
MRAPRAYRRSERRRRQRALDEVRPRAGAVPISATRHATDATAAPRTMHSREPRLSRIEDAFPHHRRPKRQGCLSRISSLKLPIVKNAASRLCRSHNRPPQRGFVMLLMSSSGGKATRSLDGTNAAQLPAGRGRPRCGAPRVGDAPRCRPSDGKRKAAGGELLSRPSGHQQDRGPPEGVTVVLFGGREVRCASL